MVNPSLSKNEMPLQPAESRCGNFDEVALGYGEQQAADEAMRCLGCKHKPCVQGCPVAIDIPLFIGQIREKNFEEAYRTITRANSLPAVCGRVCPQETQCEERCVRRNKGDAVAIGRLERFAADWHFAQKNKPPTPQPGNGRRVAVVGAGPAGLACSGELVKRGYEVTVFEALHKAGGVLVYGIPEFRLPKIVVEREVEALKAMGVHVETNQVIGRVKTVDELFEDGYEAVFIGAGAGLPRFMQIPGEQLNGVFSANEFLTRVNLMGAYREDSATPIQRIRRAVVVGGGNVAMDAARCAKRLGAHEVLLVYRRSEAELPARIEEVEHAKEEGVRFRFLCNPIAVEGDDKGRVRRVRCVEMELGDPDASGRRRPHAKEGTEFNIETDGVIMAVGTSPNPLIGTGAHGIRIHPWGGIVADEQTGATSRAGVYAAGDIVTGAATVILAMGAGKRAAVAMDEFLRAKGAQRGSGAAF